MIDIPEFPVSGIDIPETEIFGPGSTEPLTIKIDDGPWTSSAGTQAPNAFLAFRARYDQAIEAIRNPPGADETATLCWGGAPRTPGQATLGDKVSIRDPKDKAPEKKKNEDAKRIILRERNRWVERVEVKSEDDPDVILITERVRLWVANGSDGWTYFLECKPDSKNKILIQKGGSLPAEAFR